MGSPHLRSANDPICDMSVCLCLSVCPPQPPYLSLSRLSYSPFPRPSTFQHFHVGVPLIPGGSGYTPAEATPRLPGSEVLDRARAPYCRLSVANKQVSGVSPSPHSRQSSNGAPLAVSPTPPLISIHSTLGHSYARMHAQDAEIRLAGGSSWDATHPLRGSANTSRRLASPVQIMPA